MIKTFLRFARLHTVLGTTLSITALFLLASSFSATGTNAWGLWALTLISCLGANVYITGLNQLTDVEIDKINKPYLPLAAGTISRSRARWWIFSSLFLSLLLAVVGGTYLLLTVVLSLALGTAYSLPPIRLKRYHFWAAFCIIAVRGIIVNLLLFIHFNLAINGETTVPPIVWLLTATILIYSVVIAWFKDIPDMEGDRQFEVYTLSVRLGPRRVWLIGNALIIALYLILISLPLTQPLITGAWLLLFTHLGLLAALLVANHRVRIQQQASAFSYYQFIWLLFFLEYISFTAAGFFP